MTKNLSEYEIDKQKKKQNLVRNESLYHNYDDPYKKDIIQKCPVCQSVCMVDQFGNGDCDKCSWRLDRTGHELPDRVQYPDMISLNKAKKLYKDGKPLLPDFDDFIAGLAMYGEMNFEYDDRLFGVLFHANESVEFFEENGFLQKFKSVAEFKSGANIDEKLLGDIWSEVKNAYYML